MQLWISFERSIADGIGLDRDALILMAGFLASLLVAFVSRRPLGSLLAWLLVLVLGASHEAAIAFVDGAATDDELWTALPRLMLFMTLPTALALVGRFRPQLIAARPDRRILIPAVWEKRAPVVDATFKPVSSDTPAKVSTG